jgi:hypothetical protein
LRPLQFGVFPAGSDAEEAAFLSVASTLRDDFVFAHVTDAALLPAAPAGAEAAPTGAHAAMIKTFDEPHLTTAALEEEALAAWVNAKAVPRVAFLDKDPKHRAALKRVFEAPLPKLLAFGAFDGDAPADKAILDAVHAAAKAHPELKFIVGDSVRPQRTESAESASRAACAHNSSFLRLACAYRPRFWAAGCVHGLA